MKLFLMGGFLGSGKTTAIQQACMELLDNHVKAAVITNDQGLQLVDSAFISSFDIPNREVVNGCFCCNYDQLDQHIQSLQEASRPEVIFAESVGSCTDMIATVVNPLLKFHPDIDIVVTVFADASILFPLLQGNSFIFEDEVNYIYQQQMEEADVLVVNKVDLLDEEQLRETARLAEARYPGKKILYQDSRQRESIRQWLAVLNNFRADGVRRSLDIDYAVYGAGEARLAWLDEEIGIRTIDNNAVATGILLINMIYGQIKGQGLPIGHLKFLMDDGTRKRKISFTATDQPLARLEPGDNLSGSVSVLMNARVQTAPEVLKQIVAGAMKELRFHTGCRITERNLSAFQPGYPNPTYRMIS